MNYIILFGTGYVQKIKIKNIRILMSSFIGAIFAIISYKKIIPAYSNILVKILLSIIMIYVAFNPKNTKKMLKSLLLFYLISFVIGGCAIALMYIFLPKSIAIKDGHIIGNYPIKINLIAGLIGFSIIQYNFSVNKKMIKNKDLIYDLKIGINGKCIKTKAFVDSGNTLKDPFSKKPVIIVEKQIININLENTYQSGGDKVYEKIRVIPYKSIGNQNGILLGVIPDYIKIIKEDDENYIDNAIVGLYDKKIGKNYSALIGLELIK